MKITKKLLRSTFIQKLLAGLVARYVHIAYKTTRWHVTGQEILDTHVEKGPAIYVFWHGRMLLMPCLFPKSHMMDVMVSDHRDGIFIARVLAYFGLHIFWGSTDRQSSKVLREAIRNLQQGRNIAITPDGPRGPRMHINSNVLAIARIAGVPIIPVTFSTKRAYIHHGWDACVIPKWWDKGCIMYGEPFYVEKTAEDMHYYKYLLETQLNAMTEAVDRRVNREPVLPEAKQTRLKKKERSA